MSKQVRDGASIGGAVAIVGMACRYPDAIGPDELFDNAIAQRRAFRRLPAERIALSEYWSADKNAPDRFYATNAGLLEGYEFDRVRFRIAGSTYRTTDLTHWLALETAADALADAGFADGAALPKESTAVIVGNTLTGEFTRANLLRLRWPYVRRVVETTAAGSNWSAQQLLDFVTAMEPVFKHPFPGVDEDTLAGSLANTIAGRICNYFDLGGGGYTVDGACSSSLLSVAHACRALLSGEAEVAVAGGVDLSIDPFELVGFAKTGALATDDMRVYDRRSAGFWPGEGCGMLVLMRAEQALAQGHRVYAVIAGHGISSDGRGSITRPEAAGQMLALERAYARAGFDPGAVSYFEGHGTGTAVGDETEIRALSAVRRAADPDAPAAVLGTVKANIGHTKAAAGVAGVIKAAMAIHRGVIPPTTGCAEPHPALADSGSTVRTTDRAEEWREGRRRRAAVSSMGFGGINTHVVLDEAVTSSSTAVASHQDYARSAQDAELLLFDADTVADLRAHIAAVADSVGGRSYAQLGDLAAKLRTRLTGRPVRASIVAAQPTQAQRRAARLLELIDGGSTSVIDADGGISYARSVRAPRIAYAFPGQGVAGSRVNARALRRRFAVADEAFRSANLTVAAADTVDTAIVQPSVVASSIVALRTLEHLGITAEAAFGHSLGELTALHWARVCSAADIVRIAARRGGLIAQECGGDGAMVSVAASADETTALLGLGTAVAGLNGPRRTVVAGPKAAVAQLCSRASERGVETTMLAVSHAFHSPQIEPAVAGFTEFLAAEQLSTPRSSVYSTVTGAKLAEGTDLRALLATQLTSPVRFSEAVAEACAEVDLVLEVGPGRALSGMVREIAAVPAVSVDSDSSSLQGLLRAVGAAYVLGADVRHEELFTGRFMKPLPERPVLLANPCEGPLPGAELRGGLRELENPTASTPMLTPAETSGSDHAAAQSDPSGPVEDPIDLLRRLAADRAELPVEAVDEQTRLLDDLHLSSITVGQIINDAVRALGIAQPRMPLNLATASIGEVSAALTELAAAGDGARAAEFVVGIEPWIRAFAIESVETPLPPSPAAVSAGRWEVYASADHPLGVSLRAALESGDSAEDLGVVVCLPADADERHAAELLAAARHALTVGAKRFAVVAHGGVGVAALAKTLHLEHPEVAVRVITIPATATAAAIVRAELMGMAGFAEVHYDAEGVRRLPMLRLQPEHITPPDEQIALLGSDDVLLVTGGGKGITAECALAIAKETGVRVALVGRSDPDSDRELASNLDRFASAGIVYSYLNVDVTVPEQVHAAIEALRGTLGPVTAVLHGAGRNVPRALTELEDGELAATLAVKVGGLRSVLDALPAGSLRVLVSFGSIIGRGGLPGEAHYATANEAVTDLTEQYARAHPECRCYALEWSVWSGVGMGERLGVVESLARVGITPISIDDGVGILQRLLNDRHAPTTLVISGRADGIPTLPLWRRQTPLLRFVDRVLVDYPDVEMVVESELSTSSDLYLEDHVLEGNLMFPAVLGMEAMVQVACAATGRTEVPELENLSFDRPIVVERHQPRTIRVAALVRRAGVVDLSIRSAETSFQIDHFRATCRFIDGPPALAADEPAPALSRIALDPAEMYGGVLFQGRRFQRLLGYTRIGTTGCSAEVDAENRDDWFGRFLPGRLLLGNPGARDVFMHAIQSGRPDQILLPVGIGHIRAVELGGAARGVLTMEGIERERGDGSVVWDVLVRDASGQLVEKWTALRLHVVRTIDSLGGTWAPALLGPYLERCVGEISTGDALRVVVEPHARTTDRHEATAIALGRALARPVRLSHRGDGKPEIDGPESISAAHLDTLTLTVTGEIPVSCDVERVVHRSADDWAGLLGADRLRPVALLVAAGEDADLAATRLWCATECAQKAGRPLQEALTLVGHREDGWTVFAAGRTTVATYAARIEGEPEPLVFAVRIERGEV
ncbi:type I polyketide synthase [Nocardia sp. NPDC101769]|uniref:type I polyketide synthase n=1 Tax=Nocardia sp. NPDC101769 TaxID=3364333 RepID=UPI00381683D3